MKIGLLSFYKVNNYEAALQTYDLKQITENIKGSVKIINNKQISIIKLLSLLNLVGLNEQFIFISNKSMDTFSHHEDFKIPSNKLNKEKDRHIVLFKQNEILTVFK